MFVLHNVQHILICRRLYVGLSDVDSFQFCWNHVKKQGKELGSESEREKEREMETDSVSIWFRYSKFETLKILDKQCIYLNRIDNSTQNDTNNILFHVSHLPSLQSVYDQSDLMMTQIKNELIHSTTQLFRYAKNIQPKICNKNSKFHRTYAIIGEWWLCAVCNGFQIND